MMYLFFFSSRRRHTRSVSAFLLNRSSDLGLTPSQLYVFMPPRFGGMKTYNWEGVNPDGYFLDKLEPIPSALPSDRKSGSAGMPRPISYAVFFLKKKHTQHSPAFPRPNHPAPH